MVISVSLVKKKKKNAFWLNIWFTLFCCIFKFVLTYRFFPQESVFTKFQSSQKMFFFPCLGNCLLFTVYCFCFTVYCLWFMVYCLWWTVSSLRFTFYLKKKVVMLTFYCLLFFWDLLGFHSVFAIVCIPWRIIASSLE